MAAQKKGSKPAPKQTAAKKKPAQKPAQAAKKNTKQQKYVRPEASVLSFSHCCHGI